MPSYDELTVQQKKRIDLYLVVTARRRDENAAGERIKEKLQNDEPIDEPTRARILKTYTGNTEQLIRPPISGNPSGMALARETAAASIELIEDMHEQTLERAIRMGINPENPTEYLHNLSMNPKTGPNRML